MAGGGNSAVRLDANVRPTSPGAKLVIEVTGPRLAPQILNLDASAGGLIGGSVSVPTGRTGTFAVRARLLDGAGHLLGREQTDIRVAPPGLARVTIDPDGFLRVAGKREFPIGLYSAGKYNEIARAGIMVTHNYGITTGPASDPINLNDGHLKELLDQSWSNGMRMMVEVPREAVQEAKWDQISRRIETFRHHPGLLCWDSEERVARGTAPLTNIYLLYKLVHELDPDHPFVLGDSRDISKKMQKDRRNFFPDAAMDVGIWWWYPIPNTNAVPLELPSWLATAETKKPLWIAIQAYVHPWKTSRYPTPAEYRCMAYMSIIGGVKSIFFYTGFGERDFYKRPAGLLNQPENAHWDYVKKLLRELHEVTPLVLAPAAAADETMTPPRSPVKSAWREFNGALYILAANPARTPQTVTFRSHALRGHQAEVLFESRRAAINGDALGDQFAPLAVHVYKIE